MAALLSSVRSAFATVTVDSHMDFHLQPSQTERLGLENALCRVTGLYEEHEVRIGFCSTLDDLSPQDISRLPAELCVFTSPCSVLCSTSVINSSISAAFHNV